MVHDLYLVMNRPNFNDLRAAMELIRETYGVERVSAAPSYLGIVCLTKNPIPETDWDVLGVTPWH